MPLTAYATSADLTAWTGAEAPLNADMLLRSATVLVAAAANRDPYTDIPDADAAPVLRDATTAQAAAWITLGINPEAAGLDAAPVKNRKIGSGDIGYDTTGQSEARTAAATELAPEARQILYTGGLLALLEPVWTGVDHLDHFGLTGPCRPRWSQEWWQNL